MSESFTRNAETGLWGEQVAAVWLSDHGYAIVGRRVLPDRHDEIDIIVRKGDVLAFVEVKTRASEFFGRPSVAVNAAKRISNRTIRALMLLSATGPTTAVLRERFFRGHCRVQRQTGWAISGCKSS